MLYGQDTVQDDHAFDVFLIKIRTHQIISEWQTHRDKLLCEWEHKTVMPFAESLMQGIEPDRATLKNLFEQEMQT